MSKSNSKAGVALPAIKISVSLVLISISLLFFADMLGFIPDGSSHQLKSRKNVSEMLAVQVTVLDAQNDINQIEKLIREVSKRNDEIVSVGLRNEQGVFVYQSPGHQAGWGGYNLDKSTPTHIVVPLFSGGQRWGQMELRYKPLNNSYLSNFSELPIFKLSAFMLVLGSLAFFTFMLRIIRKLDPSNVIPTRVSAAFDTLAEGVIVVDESERIVLANKAFYERLGTDPKNLIGKTGSELKWFGTDDDSTLSMYPWQDTLKTGSSIMGRQISIRVKSNEEIRFLVNCSPIMDSDQTVGGALITLDDITELEERNLKLKGLVTDLKQSQIKIEKQNRELHFLATRDSLTGCLNRRAFNEEFRKAYLKAKENRLNLCCIMADLDHFKAVNDNFGHQVGDDVIKLLADVLHANCRSTDLVGRYGGEEFCLVLPNIEIDAAIQIGEKIRLSVKDTADKKFEHWETAPTVRASLGVASLENSPEDETELMRFADEALYEAKEQGRNRVVRWQPRIAEISALLKNQPATQNKQPDDSQKIINLERQVERLEKTTLQVSQELDYSRTHDGLTGLPNQSLFIDRLNVTIERAKRFEMAAGLLVVDVAALDSINLVYGRNSGNRLLKITAELLNKVFRSYDSQTLLNLSRLGSNEFAVQVTDIQSKDSIIWVINRLLKEIQTPIEIDGSQVQLDCHVGISMYPSDGVTADELINTAMIAKQYCKKATTGKHYQFYDPAFQKEALKNLQLGKELKIAVEGEQWLLHYQPKRKISNGCIVGVEALIRWQHPKRGIVMPNDFIQFAEQRGIIKDIGMWVINESCRQIKKWMNLGINHCSVAINLSTEQLKQEGFSETILEIVERHNIPPRLIQLEVTETALMTDIEVTTKNLLKFHLLGMSIAIDDFGTGYASLSYLKNLPISILKIDREFIKDLETNESDEKIVQALIDLAHSMKVDVVAEGVENSNQYELLKKMHCDQVQGYLLGEPMSAQDLDERLVCELGQQAQKNE